jgi:hypothetical protein
VTPELLLSIGINSTSLALLRIEDLTVVSIEFDADDL